MRIKEFEKKYCADIINKLEEKSSLLDTVNFMYDEIIQDDSGNFVKVICTDSGEKIPITEILTLTEADFKAQYKTEEACTAAKNYLKHFIIVEGEELLTQLQREVAEKQKRLEKYSNVNLEDLV